MATLTKIVTGMEKGPEAIDANFGAIDLEIQDTGWRQLSLTNSGGTVYIRRKGQNVVASGIFKPTAYASLPRPLDLFLIPEGFRPDLAKFKFYEAHSGSLIDVLRLQFNSDGLAMCMIYSPEKTDQADWQANFSWTTNDDFPD